MCIHVCCVCVCERETDRQADRDKDIERYKESSCSGPARKPSKLTLLFMPLWRERGREGDTGREKERHKEIERILALFWSGTP